MASIGVLAIWGQPPVQVAQALARLDADYGPRTMLGLGISSPESAREAGETYGHPIPTMSRYLDGLAQAGRPVPADRVLLGALGPKMARLATERTRGFHPFLVTPEYSVRMREQLGAAPWIAPHLAVVPDRDAARARTIARQGVGMAFGMPTYRANLTRILHGRGDCRVPNGRSSRVCCRLCDAASIIHLAAVVAEINDRPRKIHHWKKPSEVFTELLEADASTT